MNRTPPINAGEPPDHLVDNRSDPEARSVLADWHETFGHRSTRLGSAISYLHAADADAAAADAADADADAADADAADADAALRPKLNDILYGDIDMRDGLKIIQVPGRYYYSVTRIGWLRRAGGDEWELLNARTIIRTGNPRTIDSLASLGPKKDHTLSKLSEAVEECHRLILRRCFRANEEAWLEYCPRPKDWKEAAE